MTGSNTAQTAWGDTTWLVLTCDEGSVDLAEQELQRAAAHAKVAAHLAPGVLLVDARQPFEALAAAWAAAPPIFVRHICPVQTIVSLWDSPGDPEELAEALAGPASATLAEGLLPDKSFSVQTRLLAEELPYKPYDVNQSVSQRVMAKTGAALDVRSPRQVLSVVCAQLSPAVIDHLPPRAAARPACGALWAGGVIDTAAKSVGLGGRDAPLCA